MKTKILGCIVVLGAVGCLVASCTEPLAPCLVEDASGGPYIMTYTLSGAAPACATVLPGELIGMSFYHPEITNSDGSTTFDANIGHVAIQGNTLGSLLSTYGQAGAMPDPTVTDEPYAYGRFKAPLPDSNNLCYVVTDQGLTGCAAAGAGCNVDEDCCNGQCNVPASFACLADTDCPSGLTCNCKETMTATVCDDQVNGGLCQGKTVCAPNLVDDLTATENLAATPDMGALLTPKGLGAACMKPSDCGFCADMGATCAAATDCCSGVCTSKACAAPAMGMMTSSPSGLTCDPTKMACTFAACNPANMDADCGGATSGLVCDPTAKACKLGCRGSGGNGCDAAYQCSSTTNAIGSCSLPQNTVSYVWSNVQIYTTADAQGTQVAADLAFTETVNGQACTVSYKAIGIWPGVSCAAIDPTTGMPTNMPNDDACNPCSEPNSGRAVGSGINVHFPTHCDPKLLFCVLGNADSTYKLDPKAEAAGAQQVTGFVTATTIPQVLPDGDPRIITCVGE